MLQHLAFTSVTQKQITSEDNMHFVTYYNLRLKYYIKFYVVSKRIECCDVLARAIDNFKQFINKNKKNNYNSNFSTVTIPVSSSSTHLTLSLGSNFKCV